MKDITEFIKPQRPVKVVQFGGGVFLRGFFDWMLCKANKTGYNGNAVIVRSKTHGVDPLSKQNFLYTHVARDGERSDVSLIDCIAGSVDSQGELSAYLELAGLPELETVVSNTTEAGITYLECDMPNGTAPSSFPAMLTLFLYERFKLGAGGLLILPCELIENNGDTLKSFVIRHSEHWRLPESFMLWLERECSFRNTLVDRIVSGAPSEPIELGYTDTAVNTSEFFHLWAIEGEPDPRLPFDAPELNIKWVEKLERYRTLKVRLLNGAHTSLVPYALELGVESVGECMKNSTLRKHLERCLFDEIIPSLGEEMHDSAVEYANEVIRRFENPYIHHRCEAIALNSVSKFKVRVLPSIIEYQKRYGKLPRALLFSFSKLLRLYKYGAPNDDAKLVELIRGSSLHELLSNSELWGCDLSRLEPFIEELL